MDIEEDRTKCVIVSQESYEYQTEGQYRDQIVEFWAWIQRIKNRMNQQAVDQEERAEDDERQDDSSEMDVETAVKIDFTKISDVVKLDLKSILQRPEI